MRSLGPLVLTGVLVYFMFGRFVDQVIFQPSAGADWTPWQLGIDAEDIYLTTEDGVRVHAYYLASPGATRTILFLHGNAGNASHRLPNAAQLAELGAHVLVLDYRGYGLSEGTPSEAGAYADARAGLAHLLEQRGARPGSVFVFGRSLGGAVAVDLAAGLENASFAGVILESTFTSIADVARGIGGPIMGFLAGRRFDSIAKISSVDVVSGPIHSMRRGRSSSIPRHHLESSSSST